VDLMLNNEERILANSRIAIVNSYNIPIMIGCVIISTMYGIARPSLINLFFMWGWLAIAGWIFFNFNKAKKEILRLNK